MLWVAGATSKSTKIYFSVRVTVENQETILFATLWKHCCEIE